MPCRPLCALFFEIWAFCRDQKKRLEIVGHVGQKADIFLKKQQNRYIIGTGIFC